MVVIIETLCGKDEVWHLLRKVPASTRSKIRQDHVTLDYSNRLVSDMQKSEGTRDQRILMLGVELRTWVNRHVMRVGQLAGFRVAITEDLDRHIFRKVMDTPNPEIR
jgi:hypothetical protein